MGAYGYYLLIALIALCGSLVFFNRDYDAPVSQARAARQHAGMAALAPWFRDSGMVYWVALAFVPSAMMTCIVTTHITADVWLVPQ